MAEDKELYKSEEKQVRYAIVRVECPPRNEIDAQFVCFPNDNNCSGCRYGDTKEQLIAKVQQALFKSIFTEQLQKAVAIEEQKRIYKQYRPMAEKIVEFLGVK